MKHVPYWFAVAWMLVGAMGVVSAQEKATDEGYVSIFDGKTLEGWDGNPEFWSVQDGVITGRTTPEKPTNGNTFLIWRKGELAEFELKLEYRIVPNNDRGFANSGIQYRSFEVPGSKWVVGGYQADFEAGDTFSGILYGERFRGILANRGQKTVIPIGGKPEVVGTVGESKEIQSKIKKEDWNEYHITAKGFHFVHRINGVVTAEATDEDEVKRASGILALQLHAGPPMTVQFRNIRLKQLAPNAAADKGGAAAPAKSDSSQANAGKAGNAKPKKVVFIAGTPSHGYGAHEHFAGSTILAQSLQEALPAYQIEVVRNGWPQDEAVLAGADAIVMYADGGGRHPAIPHLAKLDAMAAKGVGIVCIHYAVEVPAGEPGDHFLKLIGGYFEPNWSVNPHWTASFETLPQHPITRGVKPFAIDDEWYYHMRFPKEMKGVTPILTGKPGPETLRRPDGPHSGNPHVRESVLVRKEPQHVAWAFERPEGGRGFGFTGGHWHWNWGDPNFRKLVLNAIVWTAKGDVPDTGVEASRVTLHQLESNQDFPVPTNFDREGVRQRLQLPPDQAAGSAPAAKPATTSAASASAAKPIFTTPLVTSQTPGHAISIDVDISGAKQLFLVVDDGGNGYGCDWADWAEPRLVGPAGEKKLTDLKWKSATSGWGEPRLGLNAEGHPLRIQGKPVAYGIGTHANSLIAYDLPEGFTRFQARCGLDNGGTDQGACGSSASVRFAVYTQQPGPQAFPNAPVAATHEAADALTQLTVHPLLKAQLFAAEPLMRNPTNMDVDHLGRIWVCEVVNYRRFRNQDQPERTEGDRILIVEDTDGDGRADQTRTFYQGRDVDSAHGICVLPTPQGPGTRALVSARDSVFFLIDDDGDLKADRKELLFTGIDGIEHDHGIHACVFGPDGKLYFNFGNSGRHIRDRDGKPIVDAAGNEVNDKRQPYQEGMVFRCNLDGTQFETLGWNFRNNWEVAVDSFGTMWQSDNDDDGNRATRINFVMEFGNYGYKDEFTGAAWNKERTGWEAEIPQRHWHLNDPGVIPNLLITGAGSPTGICVYEGQLLPEVLHGQVIHCDAGPNIVRAYPVKPSGAGYQAEIVNLLDGSSGNKWFRPSDVSVAPDGSLIVADWYDPGVGGHRMQDVEHGRLFRVVPQDFAAGYQAPKWDFSNPEGAIQALASPNQATRYLAWTALHQQGERAEPVLLKTLEQADNPRLQARALWLLGKLPGRGEKAVELALASKNPQLRVVGIRLARQLGQNMVTLVARHVGDESAEVRRELAIALRHQKAPEAARLWAQLAQKHDGKDRWYLEALGIAADKQWDTFLAAWLTEVGDGWSTPAGREIIWRSRARRTPEYLAKILTDPKTPPESFSRYMRAFDFLSGPEKDQALKTILGL